MNDKTMFWRLYLSFMIIWVLLVGIIALKVG